jgi:hypothetical protein
MTEPTLLRVPQHFHSVEAVLACAAKMNLTNVLVLSENEDGSLVFLDSGFDLAHTNWLLDRMKFLMLEPGSFKRRSCTTEQLWRMPTKLRNIPMTRPILLTLALLAAGPAMGETL